MSDDLNWDDDEFEAAEIVTVGQQKIAEEFQKKFDDEDKEEGEVQEQAPSVTKAENQKPSTKKETSKYKNKGAVGAIEEPLDDPVAEKLRQAKRQEESDFRNALDAFSDTQGRSLEDFTPVSAKDFDEFARLVVLKYLAPYKMNTHYKALMKSLLKDAVVGLTTNEIRDLETCLAGVRSEKLKVEKIEKENAARKNKKKSLNVGVSSISAGLDDNIYDVDEEDDYEFM